MAEEKKVRKPRSTKPKAKEAVDLLVDKALENPNMKSEAPEEYLEETAAANPEIAEMQSVPEEALLSDPEGGSLPGSGVDTAEPEDPAGVETPKSDDKVVTPEEEEAAMKAELKEDEGTELPDEVTPFEQFNAPEKQGDVVVEDPADDDYPKTAAIVKKLNPNLEDSKSKWLACVTPTSGVTHKLFKGSYLKAYNAACNYNVAHGFGNHALKVRK